MARISVPTRCVCDMCHETFYEDETSHGRALLYEGFGRLAPGNGAGRLTGAYDLCRSCKEAVVEFIEAGAQARLF